MVQKFSFFHGLFMHEPEIIAHRGGAQSGPENTLAAFRKAADAGITHFECDVHLSKDEVAVVVHDPTTALYTSDVHPIHELSLSEIQKLDAGSHFSDSFAGEKIPTLKELLETLKGKGTLMIEIKYDDPRPDLLVDRVLEDVKGFEKHVVLGSLDPSIIEKLKKRAPHLSRIAIAYDEKHLELYHSQGEKHIALHLSLAEKPLIENLQKAGIRIWVWTVNSLADLHRLRSLGVGGIITDAPIDFLKALRQ